MGIVVSNGLSIRSCLFNPLPGHVMVVTPSLPRSGSPLAYPATVLFGVDGAVYVENGKRAPLPRSWIAGPEEVLAAIEPLLDGPIRFSGAAILERRVDARQVRGVRLRRPHVLGRMLKRVDIDRQPVHSSVPVVSELPRQDFVEQTLARFATAGYRRSTCWAGCVE